MDKGRLEGIDVLRGGMCLFIIVYHSLYIFHPNRDADPTIYLLYDVGRSAMLCFFILSAFLILRRWNMESKSLERPVRRFYLRRFARIYPLWFLVATVMALMLPGIGWDHYLAQITMTFGFFIGLSPLFNFTQIGWSVFVEEIFYLFFPWLKSWIQNDFKRWTLIVVTTVSAFAWLRFTESIGDPHLVSTRAVFANLPAFVWGFQVYALWTKSFGAKTLRLMSHPLKGILILSLLLLATTVPYEFRTWLLWPAVLMALAFHGEGIIWRWLVRCGQYCYGLYLLHTPVIWLVRWLAYAAKVTLPEGYSWPMLVVISVSLLLTYLLAKISSTYFERPIISWANRST